MLEAYALGAVAPEEGAHIEEHLGECLACWDHLSESQRAAALLALAVPLEEPREDLRQRIIAQAQLETLPAAAPLPIRRGWRLPRLVAIGATAVALAAVGALSWSLVETRHLRSDYDDIQEQATISAQQVSLTRQLAGIEGQEMEASGRAAGSLRLLHVDPRRQAGGHHLPRPTACARGQGLSALDHLRPGARERRHLHSLAGRMPAHRVPEVHVCALSGVNVSLEPEGGSPNPSNEIVLTASFIAAKPRPRLTPDP